VTDDLFATAPEEIVRYFREKADRPSFDWRDVAPEEHAYAFTVAKSAGFDVLADIRAAVDDAVVNRVPFEDFRARLQPILEAKGWWGRRTVTDPKDGSEQLVQLGSSRRLRTIYWANVRSAHAAGEWERTQQTKRFLPFLVYTLSTAERRRPEHLSWVGTVLPVDDPWWRSHYPPNGWGCKCGVRQITRREAERRGYDPAAGAPPVEMRSWRNKRTGETVKVPKGIDPGWHTNPGFTRGRNLAELVEGRLERLPVEARRAAVADLVASPTYKRFVDDAVKTGARRAEIARELEAAGEEVTDEVLDARAPFLFPRLPVRIGEDGEVVWVKAREVADSVASRLVCRSINSSPKINVIDNMVTRI